MQGIVAAAVLPAERVFVIATSEHPIDVPATVLVDVGPVNIQRWWNKGIDAATRRGARHVAIFNDDVAFEPGLIQAMSERLDETGASICYTGTGSLDPCMTGWAFMINAGHGLRPDERFAWYYGDNDLRDQALKLGGETHVPDRVEHFHPGQSTNADPVLQRLATADRAVYDAQIL